MVSEWVRSQGVATKLMSPAEEWARSIPAAYVAVASRRAGDFYLRIGYQESAGYYRKTFVRPAREPVILDGCPPSRRQRIVILRIFIVQNEMMAEHDGWFSFTGGLQLVFGQQQWHILEEHPRSGELLE